MVKTAPEHLVDLAVIIFISQALQAESIRQACEGQESLEAMPVPEFMDLWVK